VVNDLDNILFFFFLCIWSVSAVVLPCGSKKGRVRHTLVVRNASPLGVGLTRLGVAVVTILAVGTAAAAVAIVAVGIGVAAGSLPSRGTGGCGGGCGEGLESRLKVPPEELLSIDLCLWLLLYGPRLAFA
jgi:hypothetical protein